MVPRIAKFRWKRRRPAVPEGIRVYAVGDIHGRADLLDGALQRIRADIAERPVARPLQVFLGDYVDRGPYSRQVLDCLSTETGICDAVFLRGNHEAYMLEFLKDPSIFQVWRQYGGVNTLLSYGLTPSFNPNPEEQIELSAALNRLLPPFHREWFTKLRDYFVCGDFLFVHAGIRPEVPLTEQSADDLLWIRDEFLCYKKAFAKMIVHGHTPVPQPDFRSNRINIDTGAFATGQLTCLVIERDEMLLL